MEAFLKHSELRHRAHYIKKEKSIIALTIQIRNNKVLLFQNLSFKCSMRHLFLTTMTKISNCDATCMYSKSLVFRN